MIRIREVCWSVFLICFFTFSSPTKIYAQAGDFRIETVVHLLGYVAMDYPGAVQNGKVTDEQEYQEQVEFASHAYDLTQSGNFTGNKKDGVLADIKKLQQLIATKASADKVKTVADNLKNKIVEITGIATAPADWPDMNNGKVLYQANCATCHGPKGDGAGQLTASLNPPPSNFLSTQLRDHFSPYQAFNSIKLGVSGTSMPAFSQLSEKQIWDLAFYIKSLPYEGNRADSQQLKSELSGITSKINLKDVATLSDSDLRAKLSTVYANPQQKLEALRLFTPEGDMTANSLNVAKTKLALALESYQSGKKSLARAQALDAYLEGIEPVEARLRIKNAGFVLDLEQQMLRVRQVIEKNKGEVIVENEVKKAQELIMQADRMMQEQKLNYWFTFILAVSIVLREALEAFLVLAVVMALIRSSGVKKALPWLHGGWIAAVVAGVAGWFLSGYIIRFGGKNREVMEGMVSLLAVIVLLFVGFWLHNNSNARQWKEFIQNKVGRYLKGDRMPGLAAFSFMVVFREAFEVILFLQAINLESDSKNTSAIGLGALAAILIVILIAIIFLKFSKKIPVRQLFLYSSWIIVLLAVILLGKGVHSLQESGWISVNEISSFFRVDWLGVYPTVESITAQFILLLIIIGSYNLHKSRHKKFVANKG